jgi:hypothetical protein
MTIPPFWAIIALRLPTLIHERIDYSVSVQLGFMRIASLHGIGEHPYTQTALPLTGRYSMDFYRTTFSVKRLWIILTTSMISMFVVLLYNGQRIYQQAPLIPVSVVTQSGSVVFSHDDIQRVQNVW